MASRDFRVVIPARYGSSRLLGKPLRLIRGEPMIQHVYARAVASGATHVVVATDDERIFAAVRGFGGEVMMTASTHESGTDRLAEVAAREGWSDDEIVVNLQGDEPLMEPTLLGLAADTLVGGVDAGVATLVTPIRNATDLFDPNVVKAVLAEDGRALYFSRAPIPWLRGRFPLAESEADLPDGFTAYRHLGLYAYRVGVLKRLSRTPPCVLERAESLEQLRALWIGVRIYAAVVETAPAYGVDTEEDLTRVERILSGS